VVHTGLLIVGKSTTTTSHTTHHIWLSIFCLHWVLSSVHPHVLFMSVERPLPCAEGGWRGWWLVEWSRPHLDNPFPKCSCTGCVSLATTQFSKNTTERKLVWWLHWWKRSHRCALGEGTTPFDAASCIVGHFFSLACTRASRIHVASCASWQIRLVFWHWYQLGPSTGEKTLLSGIVGSFGFYSQVCYLSSY